MKKQRDFIDQKEEVNQRDFIDQKEEVNESDVVEESGVIHILKKMERYLCENFEELDLEDPVEEGYFEEYESVCGATEQEFLTFEKTFYILLPEDFKALYRYKNGSKFFSVLPVIVGKADMSFCLMSLQEMTRIKEYFQNRDALLTEFSEYFTVQEIEKMQDDRIKPYLFHKKWFPFAQYCDSCYLMLDFDPDKEGKEGQIICYMHDPDKIVYVAPNIYDLLLGIQEEIGLSV